jgi:hypothetical protein
VTKRMLSTSNRELRAHRIATWSLPALSAELSDGTRVKTCPNAGACAALCYARAGTYRFSNVLAAHTRNLERTIRDLAGWEADMVAEVQRYHRGGWVRIHDSGDFYSDEYLRAWCRVAAVCPDTTFYAYTKEVTMTRAVTAEGLVPDNLRLLFSLGGQEDYLLDRDQERHADVFPDVDTLEAAGYADQSDDDRLAVVGPAKVGIPANNLRHLLKRQGGKSFGELQRLLDAKKGKVVAP